MIFKSLIAGTVLSMLAGSVVYYGTDVDQTSSATLQVPATPPQISDEVLAGEQLHPHKASDKPKGAGGKAFKPKAKKKALKEEALKKEKSISEAAIDEAVIDEAVNEATKSEKWVDDYLKSDAAEKAPAETALAQDDTSALEAETAEQIDSMMFKMLDKPAAKDAPKPMNMKEAKQPRKMEKKAAKAHHGAKSCKLAKAHTKLDMAPKKAHKKDRRCSPAQIAATIELITEQALKIEMPELRDRAYLDLVSFALKHKDYDSARVAIDGIDQIELRDTARNRMAIAYAKHGQPKAAFELLEELEVEALSDVIRLQVIESIISPESLPKEHQ